jgi:hypothetical protein
VVETTSHEGGTGSEGAGDGIDASRYRARVARSSAVTEVALAVALEVEIATITGRIETKTI